jgi:DNA-binding transcriptional LysR family regulator
MASVVQAASEGHGIAIVSWPLSKNWFDTGKLVPVFSDRVATKEKFYLAHRPEEAIRKEVKSLIDWIVSEFKSDK